MNRDEQEIAGYRDVLNVIHESFNAIPITKKATLTKIGKFTKQDIKELCPSLSVSSVEGALRKLVKVGELKKESSGKGHIMFV